MNLLFLKNKGLYDEEGKGKGKGEELKVCKRKEVLNAS